MKDNKTIEITTYIGCSNMCEYCPQVLLINRYKDLREDKDSKVQKALTLENFKKYIKTIPADIDFHFTGYVEPFDNPECEELLLLSHEQGHRIQINTTLEGLTYEKFDKIKSLPFKSFLIHLPSATYKERLGIITPRTPLPNGQPKLRDDWKEMLRHVISSKPQNLGMHSHGGTHCEALEILKELDVYNLRPHEGNSPTSTRSQNVEKVLDPKKNPQDSIKSKIPPPWNMRGRCSRVYQPVLTPDGRLGLCCQDYGLDHVAGNLSRQTWQEYRDSEAFKVIEKKGAEMCDYCDIGINTYAND